MNTDRMRRQLDRARSDRAAARTLTVTPVAGARVHARPRKGTTLSWPALDHAVEYRVIVSANAPATFTTHPAP